jgi:Lipoprotein confined to pathogenic Mycobacterium
MTTTTRRPPVRSGASRMSSGFPRSAPRQRARPVASAHVDGFTWPVTGIAAQPRPRRRRRAPVGTVLLAALVALLCAGCGHPAPSTEEKTMDPQAELEARPTLEEMTARYDEMLQRIRDRLDAEFGPVTWYKTSGRTWGNCGKTFPSHLGGRTTTSPLWVSDRNIPDDRWPHARRIVADITGEYGFAIMGLQIDRPGDHTINGFDTTLDAHYSFATQLATVLQVSSGCHRSVTPTPWATSTATAETP